MSHEESHGAFRERPQRIELVQPIRQAHLGDHGSWSQLRRGRAPGRGVARRRPSVRVHRLLAAGDQHHYDDRDVSHGVPDSEHPEPGYGGDSDQARRADSGGTRSPERNDRSRRAGSVDPRGHTQGLRAAGAPGTRRHVSRCGEPGPPRAALAGSGEPWRN